MVSNRSIYSLVFAQGKQSSQRRVCTYLIGDLAGNLVGTHGVLGRGLLVAKVGAHEHQGCGYAEPQEAQRKERAKGHCPAALLAPHLSSASIISEVSLRKAD